MLMLREEVPVSGKPELVTGFVPKLAIALAGNVEDVIVRVAC